MFVTLSYPYDGNEAGDTIDVPSDEARMLIHSGRAVEADAPTFSTTRWTPAPFNPSPTYGADNKEADHGR